MIEAIPSSSLSPVERSRKSSSIVLQALQGVGRQASAAIAMGMSESTISRLKNEHLDHFSLLLAHLGLKIVPADHVCVSRKTYEAMTHIATRAMANESVARQLVWEDE